MAGRGEGCSKSIQQKLEDALEIVVIVVLDLYAPLPAAVVDGDCRGKPVAKFVFEGGQRRIPAGSGTVSLAIPA